MCTLNNSIKRKFKILKGFFNSKNIPRTLLKYFEANIGQSNWPWAVGHFIVFTPR